MKITSIIIGLLLPFAAFDRLDPDQLRSDYLKTVNDKELCRQHIAQLSKSKDPSVLQLGYLGAFQTIWAKHVFNPISKLHSFNEGRANIERAIRSEPDNVELRFIRLSVQKGAPAFLGYRSHLQEDRQFINKNIRRISSPLLLKNIKLVLTDQKKNNEY